MRIPTIADRRARVLGFLVLLGLLALGAVACGGDQPQSSLDPEGPFAREADELWDLTFGIAAIIFFLVEAVLIFAIVRYRHRPGRRAAQFHGNTKLEVLLTAVPTLILAGIAVPTVQSIFKLAEEPSNALPVTVVAHQFWWQFEYPDQGIKTANELHIPTGRPVRVELKGAAADTVQPDESEVIHSFWVPRLAGTQDIVPGHTNYLLLEADRPGVYLGQCKEFCGLSHANMRIRVIAQTPGDFSRWVGEQQQPAAESELAAEGSRLFQEGDFAGGAPCSACHALDASIDAQPSIGPNLAHFADRETFATIFERTDENLSAWLAGPSDVKPGARMPDLGLTQEQIQALVAYLQSLE
ncbi:MAG: cytochrome c oxidase subunit II [Actinomycetota bacterium]